MNNFIKIWMGFVACYYTWGMPIVPKPVDLVLNITKKI